jgi:hypothetical protein
MRMRSISWLAMVLALACKDVDPVLTPRTTETRGEDRPGERMTPDPILECDALAPASCGEGSCVFTVEENRAACHVLEAQVGHADPCNPGLFECAAGLTCTALPRDDESTCHAVCDPSASGGCEGLTGEHPNYVCVGLEGLAYGVCTGVGIDCNPNADPCDDDEACSIVGGRAVCTAAGESKVGEDCTIEPCERGTVCVNMTGETYPKCYRPCEASAGICGTSAEVCTALEGQAFGICQAFDARCSPIAAASGCPDGETCSMSGLSVECRPVGATPIGGDCSAEPCGAGAVCARLAGDVPRCFEPCDLDLPTCSDPIMECSSIGLGFGLCV